MRARTYVYVDAFNLYYGALKGTPYKWLDLPKLCALLLPQNDVVSVKYFTALVNARPHDPNQPLRQQLYLRALRASGVEIIYGHFLSHVVAMPLAGSRSSRPQMVDVIKTEEKGSDVNLAAHLLFDGFRDRYEVAVVVSNDSDLLLPIKIVREELGKRVGLLIPYRQHPSRVLVRNVDFVKKIRQGVLKVSQFPSCLKDEKGVFHKPSSW